jgi:hypothetical protein
MKPARASLFLASAFTAVSCASAPGGRAMDPHSANATVPARAAGKTTAAHLTSPSPPLSPFKERAVECAMPVMAVAALPLLVGGYLWIGLTGGD